MVTVPNYPPSQTRVRGTGLGRTRANSYRKKGRGPPGVGEGAPSSGSGSETWTCHPQTGGCCPRTDELALSPDPGALGCVGDRPGRGDGQCCPAPRLFSSAPSLGSSITCLIPSPGLNASSLHFHSLSRVTSNVTSLLPSFLHSLVHFIQSAMKKPAWALYSKAPLKELSVELGRWTAINTPRGDRVMS